MGRERSEEEGQQWVNTSSNQYHNHPLLSKQRHQQEEEIGPTAAVLLATLVAVSGSYVFGSAVGYSSPAQSGIVDDLGLSLADYSLFGSILTIGAMIGAVVSGRIADYLGPSTPTRAKIGVTTSHRRRSCTWKDSIQEGYLK